LSNDMRVATDIGGTFTDVVVVDQDGIKGRKVLSTPSAPDRAVTEAIKSLPAISSFSHGTTVATNALLERKGARVAFVTTKGFKDLLYIARGQRPRLYDFDCARPSPVVPRDLCFEVDERLAPDGTIISPLSEADAAAVADEVLKAGAEAVAISLLFAFSHPAHEILLEKAFAKRGLPVSRSSEIIPEFREFERASTTTINAFVQPVVHAYLEKIREATKAAGGPQDYDIIKSGGGVAASAEVYPVEMLLSGPAGGVSGGLLFGKHLKRKGLVTFDMGGTSADFSAIVDGVPLWTEEGEIDGLPIRIPILDITTIGAGGGSIAWIDKGRALRVGPQSAGSEPGPACYDRGGDRPTVTDANLLSGILDPETFLGTGMRLNPGQAGQVIKSLADSAGLGMEETILGVRSVVNANMLRGIRRTTVERGIDVRDCSLLAFGGAGPIHAAELARELGMKEVLVPPMAGMFSALGILLSDVKLDFGETYIAQWNSRVRQQVDRILERFREKALKSLNRQKLDQKGTRFLAMLDMRYAGQSFHLPVPYSPEADMVKRFRGLFRKRYGYALAEANDVQVVTVRLSAVTPRDEIPLPRVSASSQHEPAGKRDILLSSGRRTVPVYYRGHMGLSFHRAGPLVVEDEGCTVFIPPGCEISVEEHGCLQITMEAR
jgi:N-methylhydantoinase A